jgi:hypothetical protein
MEDMYIQKSSILGRIGRDLQTMVDPATYSNLKIIPPNELNKFQAPEYYRHVRTCNKQTAVSTHPVDSLHILERFPK